MTPVPNASSRVATFIFSMKNSDNDRFSLDPMNRIFRRHSPDSWYLVDTAVADNKQLFWAATNLFSKSFIPLYPQEYCRVVHMESSSLSPGFCLTSSELMRWKTVQNQQDISRHPSWWDEKQYRLNKTSHFIQVDEMKNIADSTRHLTSSKLIR